MLEYIDKTRKNKEIRITALTNKSILSRVTEFVSTGCQPLDHIMGGGVPVGRMIEIYGDTSTGKSLLAAHIAAETQAAGGIAAILDSETASSEAILAAVGVDGDSLLYSIPETVEDVYKTIEELFTAKKKVAPDDLMVIIWDSVAATTCEEELERIKNKGLGQGYPAHARLISQMCRVIRTEIAKQRIAFVFINQAKEKLGVMFGNKVATFGGKAVGFYSSIRLEMKYVRQIKNKDDSKLPPLGVSVRVGVSKNKVAPPFGKCEFPILFGYGIDEASSILWWLKSRKLITGSTWKKLELPDGSELKFQQSGWEEVFYDNEEAIRGLFDSNN